MKRFEFRVDPLSELPTDTALTHLCRDGWEPWALVRTPEGPWALYLKREVP